VGICGVTVGVVLTVVGITVVFTVVGITMGETVGMLEVEFVTVSVAWWGGFAVHGGQTQPPTLSREYMDLSVGPGSP